MKVLRTVSLMATGVSVVSALSAGVANLQKWKSNGLEVNPVEAGGWHKLTSLASDPKTSLIELMKESMSAEGDGTQTQGKTLGISEEFDTLVSFLEAQGKGYDSKLVDGEWLLALAKNSKQSTKSQKLFGKMEKFGTTFQNFDVSDGTFLNLASTPRGNGQVRAKLSFNPVGEGFTKTDGKIVLRRVACKIMNASFKYWKLPKLPLPFRAKGYLDFVYLDEDLRITRGNRGGLFVHVREGVL